MKVRPNAGPGAKVHLLKSLWRAVWRFGKEENVDAREDLAHRIAELERKKGVQSGLNRGDSSAPW